MIRTTNVWGRLAGAAALALGVSACAAAGPAAAPPASSQTSLGANSAPSGMSGSMAGMDHSAMGHGSAGSMASMNHGGMDHSRMTPAQMRAMMVQCPSVRADAGRGVTLSAERQATLQHCNMMQPAAGGAPAAAHRH